MSRGSPYFTEGLKHRRRELLKRLLATPKEEWDKTIAIFSFDFDLRIEKTMEYFDLLKKAGLLEAQES